VLSSVRGPIYALQLKMPTDMTDPPLPTVCPKCGGPITIQDDSREPDPAAYLAGAVCAVCGYVVREAEHPDT
jgi:rubredoxin